MISSTPTANRYEIVTRQKSEGATYTPKVLADFVAEKMLDSFELPKKGLIRILDPACGDGALLEALVGKLDLATRRRLVVIGFDTDSDAIIKARTRLLEAYPEINLQVEQRDFLEYVLSTNDNSQLFSHCDPIEPFDLVIANPPYVRTQIMGGEKAQELARSFNLSGRVDLYYPFVLGISKTLRKNGISGIITSNRFMTTKSGQDVRREILSRFNVLNVWDLGDTKLFEAAVLPSVLIAKGRIDNTLTDVNKVAFSTIYETKEESSSESSDAIQALRQLDETVTKTPNGRRFKVRHGKLSNGGSPEGVWRITTNQTDTWLSTVEKNTWDTFRRIGKIRVGVKSTADKIFIRNDWDKLPEGRPELLKTLITSKCSRRFKAVIPDNPKHRKEILYPHIATASGRAAVDLNNYPKSAAYLEQHKEKLASRKYLIDAGRNWYELWVPHDPASWPLPKLVFRDISEQPTFWMDTDGGIVNGECYWLQCEQKKGESDLMWLALAIANSSFIESFYDHRFNNKLYAGKRRFITQYVEHFPLPNPNSSEAKEIINLSKEIHAKTPSEEADQLYQELDAKVWKIFGLGIKEISG